jgi:hypothetical protein
MEFNEKSILFASLLGSKVAQQIPRFETIQNKLGKHVLPLPPRILIPVASWDSRAGYESTGDVKAGELWTADVPKSESEQFFPFTFIDAETGEKFLLPYEPMLSISSKNNIVKRTVAKIGSEEKQQGTVKERWSRDDFEIKITGVLIGSILTGDVSQCFPRNDFQKLRDILIKKKKWGIQCEPLQLLGIDWIVVEEMNFPFTKGENVQAYEISVISDFEYSLLLEETDIQDVF